MKPRSKVTSHQGENAISLSSSNLKKFKITSHTQPWLISSQLYGHGKKYFKIIAIHISKYQWPLSGIHYYLYSYGLLVRPLITMKSLSSTLKGIPVGVLYIMGLGRFSLSQGTLLTRDPVPTPRKEEIGFPEFLMQQIIKVQLFKIMILKYNTPSKNMYIHSASGMFYNEYSFPFLFKASIVGNVSISGSSLLREKCGVTCFSSSDMPFK